jgi:hypothetical protein
LFSSSTQIITSVKSPKRSKNGRDQFTSDTEGGSEEGLIITTETGGEGEWVKGEAGGEGGEVEVRDVGNTNGERSVRENASRSDANYGKRSEPVLPFWQTIVKDTKVNK